MKIKALILFFLFCNLVSCDQYQLASPLDSTDLSSYSMENCFYLRNAKGQIVSWKSLVPVTFQISSDTPEMWQNQIRQAANAWVTPSGRKLIHIKNELSDSRHSASDDKNIVYWDLAPELFSFQQAQTITRWKSNQLKDADIVINAKDFSYYADLPNSNRQIHLKSLMIHEFGHALGLKHVPVQLSVMFAQLEYAQLRTQLVETDETSVKCEYP